MNRARTLVMVLAVLLLCAGTALATPINDPVIIVRGGTGSIHLTNLNPFPINLASPPAAPNCTTGTWNVPVSDPTSIVNGQSFVACVFFNDLPGNALITSLTFHITPLGQQLSLFNQPGNNANPYFTQATGASDTAVFSVGSVPWHQEFEVIFIGFAPGTGITQVPNAVPEPGTLALLGTGLLGIVARLRRKKA